jgi:hypothetical protein
MDQILLNGITIDELIKKLGDLIDSRIENISSINSNKNKIKFLTRNEVSQLLKISLPTLNTYSKDGVLQSYKIQNRVLYKQEEVENALHMVTNLKNKKNTP